MAYIVMFVAISVISFATYEFIRLIRKSDAESLAIIEQGKESDE